jgi:hypothetical protein
MCSIICWILSIWETLGCIFCIFGLFHALSTRGGEFEYVLSCCMYLEGFQVVSSYLWARAVPRWSSASDRCEFPGARRSCPPVWSVRWTSQSKAEVAALFCDVVCMLSSRGSLHVCRRSSLWFSSFQLVACALCLSMFCLRCVEPLPLLKGFETCLLQVILLFAFPLAFDRLLEFLLVVSFIFLFSLVTKCVCCQFTDQGGDWEPVWFEDRW